jgi:ribonuclease HI
MYRMNTRCTNNQAEAFAILKALEYVHTKLDNEVDKVTTVHTDSMMTLESLNNMYKHTFLTEEIRRKVQEMGSRGWTTRFRWTEAHVGTTGNELADKLTKEASSRIEIPISYNRVPKSVIKRDLEDNSRETWQKEWETTKKGLQQKNTSRQ